jgi:hypothetical protein
MNEKAAGNYSGGLFVCHDSWLNLFLDGAGVGHLAVLFRRGGPPGSRVGKGGLQLVLRAADDMAFAIRQIVRSLYLSNLTDFNISSSGFKSSLVV